MAYDLTKLANLLHIKTLVEKIKATFATKSEVNSTKSELNSQISSLSNQFTNLQVDINNKIASVYKPNGSKTFSELPTQSQMNTASSSGAPAMWGYVYNMTESFTTDDRFVEGAGKSYPAGTNVVIVIGNNGMQFDVLSGFVDLSGYVEKGTIATDAEVNELLDELLEA